MAPESLVVDSGAMTVVKINAITVPEDSGDELAHRFAKRAGAVDGQDGFEGFELLRPTDGKNTWLVVTRWRDEESFAAWNESRSYKKAHAEQNGTPNPQRPVGMSAQLWSFDIPDLKNL